MPRFRNERLPLGLRVAGSLALRREVRPYLSEEGRSVSVSNHEVGQGVNFVGVECTTTARNAAECQPARTSFLIAFYKVCASPLPFRQMTNAPRPKLK